MNNQTLPYRYLNIFKNPLGTNWTKYISESEKLFLHIDQGGNYLLPEAKEFFLDLGLVPKRGNLWSREPFSIPTYHTDQKENCELFAINWLLTGDPGTTEWSLKALNFKIEKNHRPLLDETDPQFWGDPAMAPDFSAVLDNPMMIRTDIPHRVNNVSTWRISYSLRFEDNPSWEVGLEKLKNYII